jgi:hypothetical protein
MYTLQTPRSSRPRTALAVATAAATCLLGLAVAPVQATTDGSGGGATSSSFDVGQMVAMRKAQMAHDFVAYAPERLALRASATPAPRYDAVHGPSGRGTREWVRGSTHRKWA